ncbi:MAG: GAF domain-containing protein [Nitrospinae bacterium]|nr:GAF domain-containing protein [Nitrospinota bacterium]
MFEYIGKHKIFRARYLYVGALLASVILYIDSLLPLGVAGGEPYVVLVLFSLFSRNRRFILAAAITGSVLTVVGYFVSPPGSTILLVFVNRLLSIIVIWVTAFLCLLQSRSAAKLIEAHAELEGRVRERTAELNAANDLLRRESAYIQLYSDIVVSANESQDVDKAMQYGLERICKESGWPVGHLYFLGKDRYLTPTRIWYFDDPLRYDTFRRVTESTPLSSGEGLPGRVMSSGKPAWIIDVTRDPNFPRAKVAENIGVRAGFAFPILIGTEIVGVMEFFSAVSVEPDPRLLRIMANIGAQLGRVIERKRAGDEREYSREQLRRLYHRLELVREEERTRIAREVHDELGQVLTTIKLELSLLDKKIDSEANNGLRERTGLMLSLVDTTIQTIKKISSDLRPPILDVLGLSEAIEWQGQEFQKRTGINFEFASFPGEINLDPGRATTLFRIFQETLTNVARHAMASELYVSLTDQDDIVILEIRDNGIGITPSQISDPRSLGILGMRERALVWGGQVDIVGEEDRGTAVTIKIRH